MRNKIKKLKSSLRIGKINISFWQGMGSVIDLFGFGARQKVEQFEKECSSFETDYDALTEDMKKVGNDFWTAFSLEEKKSFQNLDNKENNQASLAK